MKTTSCTLIDKTLRLNQAPRCLAKTRLGNLCQAPAVHGKRRCRMHGCGKGSGAPVGNQYAVTHGETTVQARIFRQTVRQTIVFSKMLFNQMSRQAVAIDLLK